MSDVLEKIESAERERALSEARWDTEQKRMEKESRNRAKAAQSAFLSHCTRANPDDYARWLHGYLKAGGSVTHVYDYDMPGSFIVANGSITVTPLFGALSKRIIVPEGVQATVKDEFSHNSVYFMDDFKAAGHFVPLYRDVAKIIRNLETAQ